MPMKNPPHPGDFLRTEVIEAAGLRSQQRQQMSDKRTNGEQNNHRDAVGHCMAKPIKPMIHGLPPPNLSRRLCRRSLPTPGWSVQLLGTSRELGQLEGAPCQLAFGALVGCRSDLLQ